MKSPGVKWRGELNQNVAVLGKEGSFSPETPRKETAVLATSLVMNPRLINAAVSVLIVG